MKDAIHLRYHRIFRFLVPLLTLFTLEGFAVGPSGRPGAEMREEMAVWEEIYRHEMAPVRNHWSRVVLAIHEGRITDLPTVCPGFRSAIQALDRTSLLAAADPAVSANVRGALDLLDMAARKCHRNRYFDLSFQMYKARYLIEVIDRRLLRYQ